MKKIRFLTLTFIFLVIVSIHSVDAASVQETPEILHHSIAANNVAEIIFSGNAINPMRKADEKQIKKIVGLINSARAKEVYDGPAPKGGLLIGVTLKNGLDISIYPCENSFLAYYGKQRGYIAIQPGFDKETLSIYHTLMISLKDSAKEIGTSIPRIHPNTVQVKVSQASLQKRIEQLEKAIAPKTPEEAVRLWFEGLKNRNGAIQFAVLAPNLRTPEWLKAYEQWDWKLPGSSPWIASYKLNGKKTGEKSWDYAVDYILIDSTGRKKIATLNLTVQQFDNNWYVSKVPKGYGGVAA